MAYQALALKTKMILPGGSGSGSCAFSSRLTHMLNRKFVRTDDAMKDSEETATAFNVSQTSHN